MPFEVDGSLTYIHVNSHHLLAQICAILEERVTDQGGVEGETDLGVEPLDEGLDRYGEVMEEGVPLRQEVGSDGGLEVGRVEDEAAGHDATPASVVVSVLCGC